MSIYTDKSVKMQEKRPFHKKYFGFKQVFWINLVFGWLNLVFGWLNLVFDNPNPKVAGVV